MTRLRWLLGTSLRGLRARGVLTLGSLLLTTIAIASAVVGPSYQGTAANSFLITQLGAQPRIDTGLTYDYRPSSGQSIDDALSSALHSTRRESGSAFLPGHAIVWQTLHTSTAISPARTPLEPTLLSVPGACAHVRLRGRCPTSPGEIAVLAADATTLGLHLGSTLNPYSDPTPFRVVGIYTPPAQDDAFWFSLGRLETIPPSPRGGPGRPAPWLTPQVSIELRHEPWFLPIDQDVRITPPLSPADAQVVALRVQALTRAASSHGLLPGLTLEPGNSLPSTIHRLLARRGVARSTVA